MQTSQHICRYCDQSCQVTLPDGAPTFIQKSFPRGAMLHTCEPGQAADKRRFGYCWRDVTAMQPEPTLGTIATRIVGLPTLGLLARKRPSALRRLERALCHDITASQCPGDREYLEAWLIAVQVVVAWKRQPDPTFHPA